VFQGVGHQDYYPENENQRFWNVYARPYGSFIPINFEDRMWSSDNRDAYFPRPIGYAAQNSELSESNNMYLQNLTYLKLRNLTVGYELPVRLIKKLSLSQVKIYLNAYDLFTWAPGFNTNYIDPEEVMRDENARGYPMGKSYSLGVKVTF